MTTEPSWPQTSGRAQDAGVDLDNCAREPIHIPGQIQPDGVLLAFDSAGTLVAWSENAVQVLQQMPTVEMSTRDLALGPEVTSLIDRCLEAMHHGDVIPEAIESTMADREVDCVAHAHAGRAI